MGKWKEGKFTLFYGGSLSCPLLLMHSTARGIWVLPTLGTQVSRIFVSSLIHSLIPRQNASKWGPPFSLEMVEMMLEKALRQERKRESRKAKGRFQKLPFLNLVTT